MTTPGQSREPARIRLGRELRRLRMHAGLSGEALAGRLSISQKSVSRFERGESLPPTRAARIVTAWLAATGATADQAAAVDDLLRLGLDEAATYRDMLAEGLAAVQREIGDVEAVSRSVRNFQPGVVPGLLQTAEYAMRIMQIANPHGATDLAEAVSVRMQRQLALYDDTKSFEFILTEAALRARPGPRELLVAQLGQVASLATLGTVDLAVVPSDAELHTIVRCGFILYEDRTDGEPPVVAIETAHALLPVTDPADVKLYRDQLDLFRESALTGPEAVRFVQELAV